MKYIKLFIPMLFLISIQAAQAQDPEVAFHAGARAYIGGDVPSAKRIVTDALKYSPSNPKLNELLKKLEEKEKQNQDQQKQQQQKDQKNEEKEKGEKTDKDDGEQEKQDQKPETGEPDDNQDRQNENADKDENMDQMAAERQDDNKISKEKAMMILEAMRNNEIQYIQQQRKKPQQRPSDNKPDW